MASYLTDSRLITVTAIGGGLEFFDFTIFALFSTYISQAFFPFESHITALINAFAVFAVGYFARPLGGLFISHFGDRVGRKNSLLISIYVMAATTLGIAILPGFVSLGLLAPVLLIFLRLLQGCALGGEMPGIITYLIEHFYQKNFVRAIAIVFGVVTFGNMLASGLGFILSSLFSPHFMMQWGWRVPFLVGALLGFVGWFIRKRAAETDVFIELEKTQALHRLPFLQLIKHHWPLIFIGAGTTALTSMTIFLFLYLPVLVHTILKQPIQEAYLFSTLSFTILGGMTMAYGVFSKNQNILRPMIIAILLILLISILAVFSRSHTTRFFEGFCLILAVLSARVNTCYPSLLGQLFPADIRYSGVATAYNIGIAFFGALTPFILLSLYKIFYTPFLPFWFLIVTSCITLACAGYASRHLKIRI